MKFINEGVNPNIHDLGIYIHIPFCVKKCDYCDFLSAPATEERKKEYFEALLIEIESYKGRMQEYTVPTIFFGGGTPSCVDAEYIKSIMEKVREVFHLEESRLEATIEVNPGTISREKLLMYKQVGINRLSFGLQSANNMELMILGRIHNYEQFLDNYLLARELGFANINIDLMSALPGQTVQTWENTLNTIISLKPEHISAYSLIIEEGTKFYDSYKEGSESFMELPDEDTDRRIYHRTKELLKEHGYIRYEISNYAKYGYECKHNSSYWLGTDYLGLGLGASSLLNGTRISNLRDDERYIELCKHYKEKKENKNIPYVADNSNIRYDHDVIGLVQSYEKLSKEQRMEEFMFLGLRMSVGVSRSAFYHRFNSDIDFVFGDVLERLNNNKLVENNGDYIHLTDYGIDVSNVVLADFLLD